MKNLLQFIVSRTAIGEHWIWNGNRTSTGYGVVSVNGHRERVHRVLYELMVGRIPNGLVIDHLCRIPLCIHPSHLEPVERRENTLRGTNPAAANAKKTRCKHGHELSGENLLWRPPYPGHRRSRICRMCRNAAKRHEYRRRST